MSDERQHSMDLNEFARLASIHEYPPHPEGNPIIITPRLADVLNDVIESACELVEDGERLGDLEDALRRLEMLHNFRRVRLGGAPR